MQPFSVGFIVLCAYICTVSSSAEPSFVVDYQSNEFLRDGRPFRVIAGSFDYFRAVPGAWRRHLRTMKSAGLNTVTTAVDWSLHNPKDGVYKWRGIANLEQFIRLAAEEDLLVSLYVGPSINAECENVCSKSNFYYKITDWTPHYNCRVLCHTGFHPNTRILNCAHKMKVT